MVDKNKRSVHQVKAERELFWYREELLKRITATWVEVSGVGVGVDLAVAVEGVGSALADLSLSARIASWWLA